MAEIRVHPRKLARSMAKAYLDQQEVTGYNKPFHFGSNGKIESGPSRFSTGWRQLAKTVYEQNPDRPELRKRKEKKV